MKNALKITLVYLVFGGFWIIASDELVFTLVGGNMPLLEKVQNFKGLIYVLLSGTLVFFLTHRTISALTKGKTLEALVEKELAEKNALINNTDDLIWSIDNQLQLVSFNQSYTKEIYRNTGKIPQQGDSVRIEAFGPEIIKKWNDYYQRGLNGEKYTITETTVLDGIQRYVKVVFNPMIHQNHVVGVNCFARDVTAENEARRDLQNSEEKYRLLFHGNPVPCWISDFKTMRFVEVNVAAIEKYGYSRDEFLSMETRNLFPADEDSVLRKEFFWGEEEEFKEGEQLAEHAIHLTKDGKILEVKIYSYLLTYLGEKAFISIALDVSNEKVTEQKIIGEVIKATENERERISMELHDNLMQIIGMGNMYIKNLAYDFAGLDTSVKYKSGLKHISSAIQICRSISHQLMPKSVLDFGLVPGILEFLEEYQAIYPIKVNFFYNEVGELSQKCRINIFRIIQEALNNVQRHANATAIDIQLLFEKSKLHLVITDNGKGFEIRDTRIINGGIGLRIIQNRASQMNGAFSLHSKAEGGTKLVIVIPR